MNQRAESLVRYAGAADLRQIIELDRATESAPHWPESVWAGLLGYCGSGETRSDRRRCILVAAASVAGTGTIFGFAVAAALDSHGGGLPAELESVAVAEGARRRGLGRALCSAVAEWSKTQGADQLELEVRSKNEAAKGLYRNLGFTEVGRRSGYYHDPEDDAVLMSLDLR